MEQISSIKFIVFDVDGVLTDGGIIVDDRGVETKRFHVRDGLAMSVAQKVGLKVGVLTSRSSRVVTLRMGELGIELLMQGVADKAVGFEQLCQRAGVLPEETAYVGDDLVDVPAMLKSGYPIAVADAAAEVREIARYVTKHPGGHGAARDAVEHILKAQDKWDAVLERYGI